jgi:hypothetical protein
MRQEFMARYATERDLPTMGGKLVATPRPENKAWKSARPGERFSNDAAFIQSFGLQFLIAARAAMRDAEVKQPSFFCIAPGDR